MPVASLPSVLMAPCESISTPLKPSASMPRLPAPCVVMAPLCWMVTVPSFAVACRPGLLSSSVSMSPVKLMVTLPALAWARIAALTLVVMSPTMVMSMSFLVMARMPKPPAP